MKKILITTSIILVILACTLKPDADENKKRLDSFQQTKNNYLEYCAGCHGYQLEEFVNKSQWLFGAAENELFKNIKIGSC